MNLQVQLDTFEGPLSLLLYLIKKNELDIYDIPIHEITQQYLEYIQIMKELNLEVAGEFIAMAATLIYIKSRMLVPQYGENGEEIVEDPRKELVEKLLEYQKFQEAGKILYKRSLLGRDVWTRGSREHLPKVDDGIELDERGLFALIAAFRQLSKEAQATPHRVVTKTISIAARLLQIRDKFKVGERIELRSLLSDTFTKVELLVTFLSILELVRLGFTRVYQSTIDGEDPHISPLYIETIKEISSDVVNRVEEFDAAGAEQTAQNIIMQAEEDLIQSTLEEEAISHINSEALNNDAEILAVESGELT